ncbi:MAG TPA: hypothetical protein VLK25_11700 [Allosphingosinicella sp.]|nr:hypothetical protein [Allosphingosinicella sp.]
MTELIAALAAFLGGVGLYVLGFVFPAICLSLICRKMGFSPLLGILAFIPTAGALLAVLLLYYMAFSKWPRWEEAGLE